MTLDKHLGFRARPPPAGGPVGLPPGFVIASWTHLAMVTMSPTTRTTVAEGWTKASATSRCG